MDQGCRTNSLICPDSHPPRPSATPPVEGTFRAKGRSASGGKKFEFKNLCSPPWRGAQRAGWVGFVSVTVQYRKFCLTPMDQARDIMRLTLYPYPKSYRIMGEYRARGLRARDDPRGAFRFPRSGIRKNLASQALDAAASGAALYKYTRKPENAADTPESPEIFRTKCGMRFQNHQTIWTSPKYP